MQPETAGRLAGWQPERLRSYSTGLRARAEWTFHAIFGVVVPMNICSPGNPWLSGFGFRASGFGTAVMQHQPKALPLVDVPLDQEFSFGFNNSHPPSYALDSQHSTPNSSRSSRCLGGDSIRFIKMFEDIRRYSKIFEDIRRYSKIFEDIRRYSMVFRVWKKNLFRNRVYWPEIIKAMQIPIPPHVTPFQARVRHQDAPRSEL